MHDGVSIQRCPTQPQVYEGNRKKAEVESEKDVSEARVGEKSKAGEEGARKEILDLETGKWGSKPREAGDPRSSAWTVAKMKASLPPSHAFGVTPVCSRCCHLPAAVGPAFVIPCAHSRN